ncbi:MAG: hypothetical protein ACFFCW_25085 [Candidatus Hodarchaeota archaeon]
MMDLLANAYAITAPIRTPPTNHQSIIYLSYSSFFTLFNIVTLQKVTATSVAITATKAIDAVIYSSNSRTDYNIYVPCFQAEVEGKARYESPDYRTS